MYVTACVGFRPMCVVWASFKDPAFIGGGRLFETQRLLEVLRYMNTDTQTA